MTVEELIEIVKAEKLYKYSYFQIGPPHNQENIGVRAGDAEIEGIFQDEEGFWRYYLEGERGSIRLAGKLHSEYEARFYPEEKAREYTEDEVCNNLLNTLRRRKSLAITNNRKKKNYVIMNKDKWW